MAMKRYILRFGDHPGFELNVLNMLMSRKLGRLSLHVDVIVEEARAAFLSSIRCMSRYGSPR